MRPLLFNIGWNAPPYNKVKKMEDRIETKIREYSNEEPVYISALEGRLIVMAGEQDLDLRDIIDWVKDNEPMLLEQE